MKRLTSLSTLSVAALSLSAVAQQKTEQPNIILFLVDDMGWQDTSVPFYKDSTIFNRTFHTPSMERLAAQGVKYTSAYAASVSSPTRVSLLSGVNPTRHGVTNWTLHKNQATDGNNKYLDFGDNVLNGLSPVAGIENTYHCTPLPEVLRQNGYSTLFVGKAHFGAIGTPGEDPLNVGFDYNIGGHAAGGPGSFLGADNYGNKPDGSTPWGVPDLEKYHGTDTFLTEALTIESINLMEKVSKEDKPFFLYLAHYAVHVPFDKDERYYQKYIDQGLEEYEARYAALVEGMDKSLGDIMDYLEETGQADNTIIIFMSDNGGYSVGVRSKTMGGINKNAPLRGGKGSLWEGGIREPMIVSAPMYTKGGVVNDSPIIVEDFYASIIELAGIKNYETVQDVESVSFVPTLKGRKINKNRNFYWHYPNDWGERGNECGAPSSAIRKGDYKLIHFYETGENLLYNTKEDIGEKNNLIGTSKKYDRIAAKMAADLTKRLKAEDSPMPYYKGTKNHVPYPSEPRK